MRVSGICLVFSSHNSIVDFARPVHSQEVTIDLKVLSSPVLGAPEDGLIERNRANQH